MGTLLAGSRALLGWKDLGASKDTPFPNAYRYRDWVIQAFNNDMPYDEFVKAQIAGDLMQGEREKLLAGARVLCAWTGRR